MISLLRLGFISIRCQPPCDVGILLLWAIPMQPAGGTRLMGSRGYKIIGGGGVKSSFTPTKKRGGGFFLAMLPFQGLQDLTQVA